MGRAIGAVAAGFVLWSVLWLGFSAGAQVGFPELIDPTQPLTHTGVLLAYIGASVLVSVASGYLCAAIRGGRAMDTVWVLSILLLVVGAIAEISYWRFTPIWYHLVFLALLIPATVLGGRLRVEGTAG
jgi:hypothetical protein